MVPTMTAAPTPTVDALAKTGHQIALLSDVAGPAPRAMADVAGPALRAMTGHRLASALPPRPADFRSAMSGLWAQLVAAAWYFFEEIAPDGWSFWARRRGIGSRPMEQTVRAVLAVAARWVCAMFKRRLDLAFPPVLPEPDTRNARGRPHPPPLPQLPQLAALVTCVQTAAPPALAGAQLAA